MAEHDPSMCPMQAQIMDVVDAADPGAIHCIFMRVCELSRSDTLPTAMRRSKMLCERILAKRMAAIGMPIKDWCHMYVGGDGGLRAASTG